MKRLVLGATILFSVLATSGCTEKSEYDGSFECKDEVTGIAIQLKVEDNKIAMGLGNMMSPAVPYVERVIKKGGKELKMAKFTSSEGEKSVFGKKDGKFWIAGREWEAYCTKK